MRLPAQLRTSPVCGTRRYRCGMTSPVPAPRPWWEPGIVYQVYPRSFQDSNGDGIGDLAGVTQRLDYLASLGVDAVWLSPIFRSPMADFGYDVADYRDVDPIFGTLADLDRLVAAAHERGLKVILDFVPNHTSERASVVPGVEVVAGQPETRLVPVGRPRGRRRAAQQLAEHVRRQRVGMGRADRPVLLPLLPRGAAGPQLAQPGGPRRDVRRAAVLAGPRHRRVPRRRDVAPGQGRRCCATTRPTRTARPAARRPTTTSCPCTRPTAPRSWRSSPGCARCSTSTATGS